MHPVEQRILTGIVSNNVTMIDKMHYEKAKMHRRSILRSDVLKVLRHPGNIRLGSGERKIGDGYQDRRAGPPSIHMRSISESSVSKAELIKSEKKSSRLMTEFDSENVVEDEMSETNQAVEQVNMTENINWIHKRNKKPNMELQESHDY